MTSGNYCCNQQNHTSNPIDVGCGSPSDEIFRHLKGRVLPLECEKKDWKSIGNYYAIDSDGTLWSLTGEGMAGVNAFNKGLPKLGNYCQVDDSTDWSEIIQGRATQDLVSDKEQCHELFLKNDGSLYTLNSKKGLDILNDSFLGNKDNSIPRNNYLNINSFPIAYDEYSTAAIDNIDRLRIVPSGIIDISINRAEAYDFVFGVPLEKKIYDEVTPYSGLCCNKITYTSNYKLEAGDSINIYFDNIAPTGCNQNGLLFPSGINCTKVVCADWPTCSRSAMQLTVDYVLSDTEFLTSDLITYYKIEDFSQSRVKVSRLDATNTIYDFMKKYSSADFPSYSFDAPIARARLSSKIEKYKILPSSTNDINKTILDDIKFSRKPSLHIKYYQPSSRNIYTSDLDSDGFYHQCSSYLRENNISYYHKNDSPLEEVEPLWKGKIDWIVAKPSGAGYFSAPTLTLIPQDNEIVTSGMSPSGLISVLPPTGIVTIDDKGTIVDIKISENPYVWNKPPQIKLEYENECIGSYDFTLKTFDNQVKISSPLKLGSISQVGQGGSLDNRGLGFVWNKLDMGPNDEGTGLSIGNLPSSSMNGFDNYTIGIRCSLSPITGYNKLVGNIFVYNGSIHLYSDTSDISLGGFIGPGIINDIVLTRNNTDNIFSAYINNQLVASFPDNNFETIFNPSEPMVFFKETGQRFSEVGRVQKIRIWTNVLASSEISKALDYPDFVEASAVCEIIGNIQGFNVKASGDGYTHACTDNSKLVLVAQARVDDLYVHGIPPQVTPTPFATPPQTPTSTPTPTITPTRTQTPSITPSITPTKTQTPTATPTYSPTPQVTNTPTLTRSPKESLTPTPSVTVTNSKTPAVTTSPTSSIPVSPTASVSSGPRIGSTPAINVTPTATQTPPPSPSRFVGATLTPSATPTVTTTKTASVTPTVTKTSTLSPTPYSPTPTTTQTPSNTFTPTITYSQTPSRTSNIDFNSITPTPSPTASPTLTISPSATSRVRKNKLKQWILADVELSPSTIEKIEFTVPLFSKDLYNIIQFIDTTDPGSRIQINPNWIGTNSGLVKKTWPSSRDDLGIALAPNPVDISGVLYTFMDSFNLNSNLFPVALNIDQYNNSFNYITPEKLATIELNDRTKSLLRNAFEHEHFTEAFILGPGKRKEYLNSSNIDNIFDYSGSFFDYIGDNSIKNLNLYICMTQPAPSGELLKAKELYFRLSTVSSGFYCNNGQIGPDNCNNMDYNYGLIVGTNSFGENDGIFFRDWILYDNNYTIGPGFPSVACFGNVKSSATSFYGVAGRSLDDFALTPGLQYITGEDSKVATRFCDVVAISGGYNIYDFETITINGPNTSRTYTNGLVTHDETKEAEYINPDDVIIPVKVVLGQSAFTGQPIINDTGLRFNATRWMDYQPAPWNVQITPTGFAIAYTVFDPLNPFPSYSYYFIEQQGIQAIEDFKDKVEPKDASVSWNCPARKYFYKITDFMKTKNSIPRIPINKNMPATKKETAKIYFSCNEFGEGAIATLNAISGPSGYIICDSCTLIKNNSYRCEPSGLIRTTGHDIPTHVGSNDHNFVGDIKFHNAVLAFNGSYWNSSFYKGLGTDNNLYSIIDSRLYKDGGGVKFNFKTQTLGPEAPFNLNYVVSPPDYLPDTNAIIDITSLQVPPNNQCYIGEYHSPKILSLNTLSQVSKTSIFYSLSNTRIGFGYYEDPEILNIGYQIPDYIFNPSASSVLTIEELINIPRTLSTEFLKLSCSIIPYNVDQLYSNGLISQNNNYFIIDTPLEAPTYVYGFIEPQDVKQFKPGLDGYLFAYRSDSLGGVSSSSFVDSLFDNQARILFFEPRLGFRGPLILEGGNYKDNNSAKLNIVLSENTIDGNEGVLSPLSAGAAPRLIGKKYWSISDIDIIDGGYGYNAGDTLAIIDTDNDPTRTLNSFSYFEGGYYFSFGESAIVSVASIGDSGNITNINISNSGRYYALDPFYGYCQYYPNLSFGLKDGKVSPFPKDKKFSLEINNKHKFLQSNPYFYVTDVCEDKEKIANYIENNIDSLQNGSLNVRVTIESNGSPVPFSKICNNPDFTTPTSFIIQDYYADSEYSSAAISGSLLIECGCVPNNIVFDGGIIGATIFETALIVQPPYLLDGPALGPYYDSYAVKLSDGSTLDSIKYRYYQLEDIDDINSAINYNNYFIVNKELSNINDITAASNITNGGVWIVDDEDQLKLIIIKPQLDFYFPYQNTYYHNPSYYLYAIKSCLLCNHPLYDKNIKSIKGKIILTEDDQVYKIF